MDPKTAVKVALTKRQMTVGELAARLGVPPQSVSRTLNTPVPNGKSLWPRILAALSLRVEVVED